VARHARGPAVLTVRLRPESSLRLRRTDAVTLLTGYVVLLMAIPSSLVVGPLGAAGAPAGLFAAVLLCWYLLARQDPRLPLARGQQPVRLAAIFFGCATLATYVSVNRTSMPGLEENGADRGLILLAGWLGVMLVAADGIDRPDRLATLLRRVVIGATGMAVLGVVEFFSGLDLAKYIVIPGLSVHTPVTDLMSINGLARVTATAAQPLELCAVLLMSLPLAIHQARFAPATLRTRRWLQVALIVGATTMTLSRTSILGFAVVAIVLVPTWSRGDRRRAFIVLLASFTMAWLVEPSLINDFARLFGNIGANTDVASRTGAYFSAASLIAQHPWLGQGFQTFFPQTYFFVDNQYLTSLIETGFIGLLALVTLLATGWCVARSARRVAVDTETRELLQCLAASVAAAAVSFSTFDALSFEIAPGLAFLVLGCAGATWRLTRGQLAELA
jgi:polysaccharide biosynthesis protein PslJ